MFSSELICCQDYAEKKTTESIFTKFDVKVTNEPREKPLDSGGTQ